MFRSSPEPTLRVELELQIHDPGSRDRASGAVRIVKECQGAGIPNLRAELILAMLELKTGVCRSVSEARQQLVINLRRVRDITTSQGYDVATGGIHPFHRTDADVVFPAERCKRLQERLAWLIYQRVLLEDDDVLKRAL